MRRLIAAACMTWMLICMGAGDVLAYNYYADPVNGNDTNSGTLSLPWRTLRNSVGKLSAGDTLYLRGGNYNETGVINISTSGTNAQHITIKNYANEVPVIDGGFPEFRSVPNNNWVVWDSGRNIYCSTKTYPNLVNGGLHAYLTEGNTTTHLIAYESYEDLASDNQLWPGTGSKYLGPGVFWNSSDQKIYIRLVRSDLEEQMGYLIPATLNPGQNSIFIVRSAQVIDFENNVSYIDLDGVTVKYRNNALRFSSGHHINVSNVTVLGGSTFIYTLQEAHDLVFNNITANGYFPEWLAFRDIKSSPFTAHAMEVSAFVLHGSENVTIMNSTIRNVMDAIGGGGNNFSIHHNNFFDIRDDVLQLDTDYGNVDMAYNKVINCSKSFDRDGAGNANAAYLGTKYVHHNIIDLRKRHLHFRPGDPLFLQAGGDGKIHNRAFGTHGTVDMDP